MPRVEIEAIVTGSRPIPAYGGVRLADGVLDRMADALKSGQVPMLMQHDIRKRSDATILDAQVRETSDGYKEVWVRFLIDADEWQQYEEERRAAGAPGGFSFACSEPLAVVQGLDGTSGSFELAADASHWSDEELLAAANDLRSAGTVSVGRRYEFAHDPAAVVFLAVVAPVALGLITNALYDGLKRFLRPEKRTIFHFRVQRDTGVVDARLETNDTDALSSALATFDQLVNPDRVFVWDESSNQWRPH